MKCDICGTEGAHPLEVSRSYGRGGDLVVVENIPVISCPHCGEKYLTADTLREIERLRKERRNLAVKREVEILSYP